jgi:hypothetical protein
MVNGAAADRRANRDLKNCIMWGAKSRARYLCFRSHRERLENTRLCNLRSFALHLVAYLSSFKAILLLLLPTVDHSFKDVLVKFAKMSQNEPLGPRLPYPEVTLHPVPPPLGPASSLLQGILTKPGANRSTNFSPTLARLLTAPASRTLKSLQHGALKFAFFLWHCFFENGVNRLLNYFNDVDFGLWKWNSFI